MAEHGTPSRYNAGCRCDDCRTRARERQRANRAARRGKPATTHGLTGYQLFGCRCAVCTEAGQQENRRYREQLPTRPMQHIRGGSSSMCPCDPCRAKHRARSKLLQERQQAASLATARRHRYEWTGPELEILASRPGLTAAEAARLLGRTVAAIRHMRARLEVDPRKQARL